MLRTRTSSARLLTSAVVPAVTATLAMAAGAIHLAHNYLPLQAPSGAGNPPGGAAMQAGGGVSGLMSLVMPHLSQVMVLNFVGFVGLAVVLIAIARLRSQLRGLVDVVLALLRVAPLYAGSAMGRANPYGTGTMALVVELALVVIALADAALVAVTRIATRRTAEVVAADAVRS